MTRIVLTRSAARSLRRMDKTTQRRVTAALDKLEANPDRRDLDIRPLTGQAGFRLRVGDWRVLFERGGATVTVQAIRPRGQAYKR